MGSLTMKFHEWALSMKKHKETLARITDKFLIIPKEHMVH